MSIMSEILTEGMSIAESGEFGLFIFEAKEWETFSNLEDCDVAAHFAEVELNYTEVWLALPAMESSSEFGGVGMWVPAQVQILHTATKDKPTYTIEKVA